MQKTVDKISNEEYRQAITNYEDFLPHKKIWTNMGKISYSNMV